MTDKKIIGVDIDGTIANCNHRLHHIKNGNRNWDEFWKTIHLDEPIHDVIALVHAMQAAGHPIFIITARNNEVRPETEAWLTANGITYDRFYCRQDGDQRKDEIVKREMIAEIRKEGFEFLFMLEDRAHNVKMFREQGVTCLQVADDEDGPRGRNWNGQTFLTMAVGPSGAGKSTYSKQAGFLPSQIISSDEIRETLTPWRRYENPEETWKLVTNEQHAHVWHTVHQLVKTRLECGLPTFLDATNIAARDRKAVLKVVPDTQRVRYVLIDRPLDEKLKTRDWRSEELVRKHHDSFQASLKYALRGDDLPFVDVIDARQFTKQVA